MNTDSIYSIISLIDKQISKIKLIDSNKIAVDHLFDLRNNIILTYKPDPSHDWSFKNKKLLNFFGREIKWVKP